jgi:hypothetical protein
MRNTGTVGIVALTAFTAMVVAFGSGCTAPNTGGGLQPLDAAIITTSGAHAESHIAVHQQGALDPSGSDVRLQVQDAKVRVRVEEGARGAIVDTLEISLANMDMPSSSLLPAGVKLRDQKLTITDPKRARVELASADRLVLRVLGRLKYDSKMLLEDGSLYPLGASYTEISDLDFDIARDATGQLTVTFDAAPKSECAAIGELMTLSKCALFVEADASVTAQK